MLARWARTRHTPSLARRQPSFSTLYHDGINGHLRDLAKQGRIKDVIGLLQHLNKYDIDVSSDTYAFLLQECTKVKGFSQGRQIHANVQQNRLPLGLRLGNRLVEMYTKCGDMAEAALVFEAMSERNVVTWTLMIGSYIKFGCTMEHFTLFWRMLSENGVKPNKCTFLAVLKACTTLEQVKDIHLCIVRYNLEDDDFLRSTLINLYSKCGSVELAHELFVGKAPAQDVVTWNSMISSFAQYGHSLLAIALFIQIQQEGINPDEVTFTSVLKACAALGALKQGQFVHCFARETTPKLSVCIQNALIDMYAKCDSFESAGTVFSNMLEPNVISWTAMIAACTQHGFCEEALRLFRHMQQEVANPDDLAYASAMKACANLAAFDSGKLVHSCMVKHGIKPFTFLENTLIDMYAKCGSMGLALEIFDRMRERDPVSWSSMVSGYALHGSAIEAFQLLQQMLYLRLELDHVTYVGLLSACKHAGLVTEGLHCFVSMSQDHGLTPTAEHCACMVDMLTRAGRLEQAFEFICTSDCPSSEELWTAVLAACRSFRELTVAKHAAERLLEVKPQNNGAFVLLSNIYAEAGRWQERATLRKLMEEMWAENG